jgi:hypothetical protein
MSAVAAALILGGCAGQQSYVRPASSMQPGSNMVLIPKSRDVVWNAAVPALSKQFFVINNLDKSSGLINVSYTGDPEKYVDCGRVTSYVKNARGERTYEFAGAAAQQTYEIMEPGGLFFIDRRMSLEGRVNLIFEEVSPTETRVTANTRYVVQRQRNVRDVQNRTQSLNDSVSFNTGSTATFPSPGTAQGTECGAKGSLEQEILAAVR